MKRHAAVTLLRVTCMLSVAGGAVDTLRFAFGTSTGRKLTGDPFINKSPLSDPLSHPTFSPVRLGELQANLLDDVTVPGLAKPGDGILLHRVINRINPATPDSLIPSSSLFPKTEILLMSEELGLFGPATKLTDWNFALPVSPGSNITFGQWISQDVNGGPTGGDMANSAIGFSGGGQAFAVVPVPAPTKFVPAGDSLVAGCICAANQPRPTLTVTEASNASLSLRGRGG